MSGHRLGLVLGLFFALWHTFWAILVAGGWAQPLLNFIFWAHFIDPPYHVGAFDLPRAGILILVTSVLGYLIGWIIGLIWGAATRTEEGKG